MAFKNKFRPEFCDSEFYVKNLQNFQTIQNYTRPLEPFEQIATWIICLSCLRRPDDWFAGFNQNIIISKNSEALFNLFNSIGLSWPKKLTTGIHIKEFSQSVKIKSLPEIAMMALKHFLNHKYQLQFLDFEPEPHFLLKLQIQNQRVMTFNPDFKLWSKLKYGQRDPLSFWIHDLIHAEHFFSNDENRIGQIGFYKFTQEILDNKILDELLLNADFNSSFSYLISDMNSHPVHLVKTLKAIIDIHSLKEKNIWDMILQNVKNTNFDLNNEVFEIFEIINTPLFNTDHAEKLTLYFKHFKFFSKNKDDHFDIQSI